MRTINPIIVVALAFALLFNTCKRDGLFFKCKPENTIKIPPHIMDFFYFKTGSWWVYECEQTGYRDSLYAKNDFTIIDKVKGAKKECNLAGVNVLKLEDFKYIVDKGTHSIWVIMV